MNRLIVFLAATCVALTAFSTPDTGAPKVSRLGMRYKTGGTIVRPLPKGAKAIVFVNATGTDSVALDGFVKRFEALTSSLYVKRVSGPIESVATGTGDVVIALVAKGDLAILPSRHMAVIPVTSNEQDTQKDLWKATVAVFSLMGEPPNDFSGAALIRSAAESIGIPHAEKVFYKKALEEGWAPPPSDEFQRAVWTRFKADKERGPTKPLAILPPSKK